jgi:hypothetical protein
MPTSSFRSWVVRATARWPRSHPLPTRIQLQPKPTDCSDRTQRRASFDPVYSKRPRQLRMQIVDLLLYCFKRLRKPLVLASGAAQDLPAEVPSHSRKRKQPLFCELQLARDGACVIRAPLGWRAVRLRSVTQPARRDLVVFSLVTAARHRDHVVDAICPLFLAVETDSVLRYLVRLALPLAFPSAA